jgi:hypothetical protein
VLNRGNIEAVGQLEPPTSPRGGPNLDRAKPCTADIARATLRT